MRQERTVQASIFDLFAEHEIGRELKAMSQWLDEQRHLLESGGWGPAPARGQGDRPRGPAGGGCAALRAAQAVSPAQLPGIGVPPGGLRLVPGVRPAAMGLEPEEVGPAQDDQRDPGVDLGRNQQGAAVERAAGETGERQRRACGQHRHRGPHARTERQQPVVGCRAGDGAAVAAGGQIEQRCACLARSLPRSQEARAGDQILPRPVETGPALSRLAEDHAHDAGLSPASGGAADPGVRPGRRLVWQASSATIGR